MSVIRRMLVACVSMVALMVAVFGTSFAAEPEPLQTSTRIA